MRLPEKAVRALAFAGLGALLSDSSIARLETALRQAGAKRADSRAGREWASASVFVALVFGAIAAFVSIAAAGEFLVAVAAFFLGFALVFAACFNAPRLAAARRAQELERDFAVALRAIAIELSTGSSFEAALRREAAGAANEESELSRELQRVLFEGEKTGLPEALSRAGERCASAAAHRAFAQLRFAFEHGGRGEAAAAPLRKIADELVALQKARAREFAAKQAFFGLLFVSVACVAPALFAAYVIVGGAFLELSFGANEVFAAFLVLFPFFDALILGFLLWKTPKLLTS